jgi:Ca2+-binding EF-hand superfamily protein
MKDTISTPDRSSSGSGKRASKPVSADYGTIMLIQKLKVEMKTRGGDGYFALQRKFRIMDDDNSKSLNMAEFKKAMKEMNMGLSDPELRMLFDHFDADHSGSIGFEEFIQGVRDPLTERRLNLVLLAFNRLDTDKTGIIDAAELIDKYDATRHPDVLSGKSSPQKVLSDWMSNFEVGGVVDGKVTQQEFINYYTNLGASIDNEDYFELMIRNAWHISGGEGAAANSANRRVLVTRADGSQYVEEIRDDLGLKANDKDGMMARLRQQGVSAASISLFDGGDDGVGADKRSTNATRANPIFGRDADAVVKPSRKVFANSSQISFA